MKMEPYKVVAPPPTPQPVELHASGYPIAQVIQNGNMLYVQSIQQRLFVEDMIEGVKEYAKDLGFHVKYVLYDAEYDRFEFELEKA
jgi:hypothetical protein